MTDPKLARISAHFIATDEHALVTVAGTYEREGDEDVVRDAEGKMIASFDPKQVKLSASRHIPDK